MVAEVQWRRCSGGGAVAEVEWQRCSGGGAAAEVPRSNAPCKNMCHQYRELSSSGYLARGVYQ